MSKGIFITGTGTDVGKTYITALIVKYLKQKGYKTSYYKAAASGNPITDGKVVAQDAKCIIDAAGLDKNPNDLVSYIFKEAISPHLAAKREKNKIEILKILSDYKKIYNDNDYVTVEGSGGILCPLRYDDKKLWLEDVIKALNLPVLVVANAKLGSINSIGLTVHYLKSKNIKIKGIILNEYDKNNFMEEDNKKMIEDLTGIKTIACVPHNCKDFDFNGIEKLYE